MVQKTAKFGGTASDVVVAKVGHGLMMMTWKPTPVPDEQCFEAIKAGLDGLDSLPAGTKMLINSAEFYGMSSPTLNLELVAKFFEKHPEYVDKAFLSVKGGLTEKLSPDASPEGLRRSVDNINEKLRGKKRMDLFEPARVDPNYSIEHTMTELSKLISKGKFDHIGLSEVSAQTIARANKVLPVAGVEIEVSPWSYTQETKDVIATCKELGIAVAAYSGFLTEGDFRRKYTRFQADVMKHNFITVNALKAIADKKNITPAQLCIAWVGHLGDHVIPLPGSSRKDRTLGNFAGGEVDLSEEDLDEIAKVLETHPIKGSRIIYLVPLKEAWLSGVRDWTAAQRGAYANDLTRFQLVAVTDNLNKSKGVISLIIRGTDI
ncbi:hypothetical protein EWM64_g7309 [Hericium alpestre]|uniref:NADP-dependent oxidoreductase domain-containing protein n=1 Tax=Hericium alpestre TaxID=135208 RepID=A0A4Y9ZRP6_9AGAM|nr:hypothetical protein EWM64_g7309 [Hericium alpestre]